MNNRRRSPTNNELAVSPLVTHLLEFRKRLIRILIILAVLFALLYPFANRIYAALAKPLLQNLPLHSSMIATEVSSPFVAPLKLALLCALLLAIPYILYQAWAFIAPGLYRQEKSIALPTLVISVLLFYTGIAFAYYLVCPLIFKFFVHTTPAGVQMMTDINAYLAFNIKLFLAFGVAFEMPILTFILALTGIVSVNTFTKKRAHVFVGCFIVAMFLTPPDIFSQTLLAIPMWLLFEIGLIAARLIHRHRTHLNHK